MLEKPSIFYDVMGLSLGLLGLDSDAWRIHRKIINPTFNPKVLKSFIPIFIKKADVMIASISKKVDGEEFDLFAETMQCTMRTIFGWFERYHLFENGLNCYSISDTTMGNDGFTDDEINYAVEHMHK
jgi:cytochrome P450